MSRTRQIARKECLKFLYILTPMGVTGPPNCGRPGFAAGVAVGVGPGLIREDVRAIELVRRELVDRVVHERPKNRDPRGDKPEVGAHVGEQVDLERGDLALLRRCEGQPLPLVTPVVARDERLAAGFGPLARLARMARREEGDHLFGGDLELPAEAAANVRGDYPNLQTCQFIRELVSSAAAKRLHK